MLHTRMKTVGSQEVIICGFLTGVHVPFRNGTMMPIWDRGEQLPLNDIVAAHLLRMENFSIPVSPLAFIGFGGVSGGSGGQSDWETRIGFAPANNDTLVQQCVNATRGAFTNNVVAMFTTFNGFQAKTVGRKIDGENPVLHANVMGSMDAISASYEFIRGLQDHSSGIYHPDIRLTGLSKDTWRFEDVRFWNVTTPYPEFRSVLSEWMPAVRRNMEDKYYDQVVLGTMVWYRNFSVTMSERHVSRIGYDIYTCLRDPHWGTLFWIQAFRVEHLLDFVWTPDVDAGEFSGDQVVLELGSVAPYRVTTRLSQLCDLKVDYQAPGGDPLDPESYQSIFDYGGPGNAGINPSNAWWSERVRGYWVTPNSTLQASRIVVNWGPTRSAGYVSTSGTYAGTLPDHVIGFDKQVGYYESGGKSFVSFKKVAEGCISDCLGGMFLPFKDGLDTHLKVIGDNHLETLSEIDGIFDPVMLLPALKQVIHLKGNQSRLKAVLDFLADAKLTYALNLAPSIPAAKRLAEKARTTHKNVNDRYKPTMVRGKWTGKLYNPGGEFDEFTVTLRTKSLIRMKEDTLFANLLTANEWGILPSLGNVWGLIPLSFVLDWFTKTGSALELVDTQTAILAVEHLYTVATFRISYGFDQQYLADRGIAGSGPLPRSGTGYTYFGRYVHSGVPMILPTRLNVLGDIGVPDWSLAGALIYKVLL